MSKTVEAIQTAFRTINGSDKKTKALSKVAVHRAVISTTESGEKYVTENTSKIKKGGNGVQTRKLSPKEKDWTMGSPTPVNKKGTTIKDLETTAGKGKRYNLL